MIHSEWRHTKTPVEARGGLVTARHPVAAAVGARVLHRGGNALDASIAAMLATGVAQPFATTIGGGGLLTAAMPDGRAYSMDYRSEAPSGAAPDMFAVGRITPGLFGWALPGRVNEIGHLAVGVPGAVPGYQAAHGELGRLPWQGVMAPAIELAEGGIETDWFGSLMQGVYLDQLLRYETTARTFLRDGQYPHRPATSAPGDLFRQPRLAATLREVANGGLDAYLADSAADALSTEMATRGGLVTRADISSYQPRLTPPDEIAYRGHRILGPAHGGIYGLLFAVLQLLDIACTDALAPRRLHLVAEAIRRCRHVENVHAGDHQSPVWVEHPTVATEMAETIDPDRRTDDWRDAWWSQGQSSAEIRPEGTAHVSVIDADGMAVSLTETVLGAFGSAVTTYAGMLLNNAMFGFVPVPGHPNSIRPGYRPHSNMTPLVVLDQSNRPVIAAGASGGQRISAATVQLVTYMLDQGMAPQDAANTPRLDVHGDRVLLDANIPVTVASDLDRRGHHVQRVHDDLTTFHFANPAALTVNEDGVIRSGMNPLHITAACGLDDE